MASRFLKLKKTIGVHRGRLNDEEFVRLITKQRDSQLKFDTTDKWGRERGGGPEIGARNSHNNYRSSVNLFFVPLPGPLRPPSPSAGGRAFQQRKTSRHKADRFSRLIHLVEVNKHCVPYLSSGTINARVEPFGPLPRHFLPPVLLRFHPASAPTRHHCAPRRLWCFP